MKRMRFFSLGVVCYRSALAATSLLLRDSLGGDEHADIKPNHKHHDEAVKRLQDLDCAGFARLGDPGIPGGRGVTWRSSPRSGFQQADCGSTPTKTGRVRVLDSGCAENGRALFHVDCEKVRSVRWSSPATERRSDNRHLAKCMIGRGA